MHGLELRDILQIAALVFYGGVTWQNLRENTRRIAALEKKQPNVDRVCTEHDFVKARGIACFQEEK